MIKKYLPFLVFYILIIILACKPKTDLYLERGLDILSNKKEIDFNVSPDIKIKELGIIRDQKEGIKTLVFKLDDMVLQESFTDVNTIGVRVWIVDDKETKRIEDWDFKPKLFQVNQHKYILKEINIKEDQIKRMKIYMYTILDGKKHKIGNSLTLFKVNTYND